MDRGASLVEYGAVVLLVAAIAAALTSVVSPVRISDAVSNAIGCLTLSGDCAGKDADTSGQPDAPDTQPSPEGGGDPFTASPGARGSAPEPDTPPSQDADLPTSENTGEGNDDPIDANPVTSFVFGLGGGPELAPDPETKPGDVNDWWEKLSAAEREEVMREEPEHIRGLDGVPAEVRNELNRKFLSNEVDRMLEEEGLTRGEVGKYTLDQVRDNPVDDAPTLELWELTKLERTLNGKGKDGKRGKGSYLLKLDPEEEHAIVATANPDTADNVSTLVPGTGIEWTAVNGQLGRANNLHDSAKRADREADHAVISWLGYDRPGWGGAALTDSARSGKDDLQDFQYGLRTTHEGDEPSNNTLIGHSYGSVVVGYAARNKSGVYSDNLVLVGSPGVGSELSKLNFDGEMKDIHVVSSEADWVTNKGVTGHDPQWMDDPNVTHVKTDPDTEHDAYFNKPRPKGKGKGKKKPPETIEMKHMGEVIAGTNDD